MQLTLFDMKYIFIPEAYIKPQFNAKIYSKNKKIDIPFFQKD